MVGFVGILVLAGAPLWAPSPQQPSVDLNDPAVVGAGRILFARSCSVGYCHGAEGRAGGGPRLRGKQWEPGYLYRVTAEGIPRSSMPGWKEKLSQDEIWSVVAYVMSLSDPEASGAAEASSAAAPGPGESAPQSGETTGPTEPLPEAGKVQAGLRGEPDKGRELFFDAADDLNCAQCHRTRGMGAEVGPDLSGLADRPARQILRDIVLPGARLSSQPALFELTTTAGERLMVLKAGEQEQRIRFYDITALPPVRRTLNRDRVQSLEPQPGSPMPDSYGRRYTLKQLLDLVSFLKAGEPGSSSAVTLEDLLGDQRVTR
ncbi:MAG: c-type cytochrome [Acidobacteria bacterium]|nr:c-type cytochrome [Acidobacteriota bacterium]